MSDYKLFLSCTWHDNLLKCVVINRKRKITNWFDLLHIFIYKTVRGYHGNWFGTWSGILYLPKFGNAIKPQADGRSG